MVDGSGGERREGEDGEEATRFLMDSSENSLNSWANNQRYERGLGDQYVLVE